jgi:hypothetical protein
MEITDRERAGSRDSKVSELLELHSGWQFGRFSASTADIQAMVEPTRGVAHSDWPGAEIRLLAYPGGQAHMQVLAGVVLSIGVRERTDESEILASGSAGLVMSPTAIDNPCRGLSHSPGAGFWSQATARLELLSGLGRNWDSYGAVPITREAIDGARDLLQAAFHAAGYSIPLPFIAPCPDGGIQIEWSLSSGGELLLDVPPGGVPIGYLLVKAQEGSEHELEGKMPSMSHFDALIRAYSLRF